jgi:hypothetical protein
VTGVADRRQPQQADGFGRRGERQHEWGGEGDDER